KDFVLLLHYGMSGVVRMVAQSEERRKHEHVSMNLTNGRSLRFECTRRFSIFEVHELEKGKLYPAVLDELGVEPLSDEFTVEYLFAALSARRGALKNAIMDNAIVVGIGNIYAAESLFDAGLSPLRSANTLSLVECEKLVMAAKRILAESIAIGGTTIHDYRQVDGSEGKFVNNLKMYGREGERCPVCGSIIEQCRIGGRSSCYCPRCQK
ncbi:MAG: bifunctional DNA-formamidopyrimidine glycosylase/DNA-(apurinic or apyrimidinic site) lyase, partial [Victivallaceae bacterium]